MEPYPIPKEVWFLVDHLYRHGLKKQNLFLLPGLHSELIAIRNWLDNGSSDPLRILFHSFHLLLFDVLPILNSLTIFKSWQSPFNSRGIAFTS